MRSGIEALRDKLGKESDADRMGSVTAFVEHSGRLMGMFLKGQVPTLPNRYLPVTSTPVQAMAGDQLIGTSGLPEAAVAAGIFGSLLNDGKIQLKAANPMAFGSGAFSSKAS